MKVKKKRKTGYILLVLAAVLLGLLIQGALGYFRYRQETQDAMLLLEELGGQARTAAESELSLRAAQWAEAEPRLAALPAERRNAPQEGNPELLMLVNPWNPLPEGYEPEIEFVYRLQGRDYWLDTRCVADFKLMMNDCRAAGAQPYLCSAHRTWEKQEQLFNEKIRNLVWEEHYAWENAPAVAAQTVAVPGTSEHQLGLAVDIIDWEHPYLDEEQENTRSQIWLMEHCWDYGFILRYPNGTTELTGIIYEPWHYRYVGQPYAQEIHRMGLTLEEYLTLRQGR